MGLPGADELFHQLVLAPVIEPTSKADSLRVIGRSSWRQCRTRR